MAVKYSHHPNEVYALKQEFSRYDFLYKVMIEKKFFHSANMYRRKKERVKQEALKKFNIILD